MTKEEIYAKCKEDYPKGTKFKSAYNSDRHDIVKTDDYYIEPDTKNVFADNDDGECLRYNGNWAEIILKPHLTCEIY